MRLIHSTTLEVHEFLQDQIPPYAILSHTWGKEEVSFQEMQSRTADSKEGFVKVQRFCELVLLHGYDYAWVDTCCIDKSSSAELSEAINSMYRWYMDADVCYVILSDVSSDEDPRRLDSMFRKSRWFKRGWTLQELLAPSSVTFFDSDWSELGTKLSLRDLIAEITKIQVEALSQYGLDYFSVAQRMAWASERSTTRTEDIAYCLMGIFKVNMPLLYGEGRNAFIRLQEEIMKTSNDDSLFAWIARKDSWMLNPGLLSRSPAAFHNSGSVLRGSNPWTTTRFPWTNGLVEIQLPFMLLKRESRSNTTALCSNPDHRSSEWKQDIYLAVLNCQTSEKMDHMLAICLRRTPEKNGHFIRVETYSFLTIPYSKGLKLQRKRIFIQAKPDLIFSNVIIHGNTTICIRIAAAQGQQLSVVEVCPVRSTTEPGSSHPAPFSTPTFAIRFASEMANLFDLVFKLELRLLKALLKVTIPGETLIEVVQSNHGHHRWTPGEPFSDCIYLQHPSGTRISGTIRKVGPRWKQNGSLHGENPALERTYLIQKGWVTEASSVGDIKSDEIDGRFLIELDLVQDFERATKGQEV